VAIKEHVLIGIMQSRCKRENAGIVLLLRSGRADVVLSVPALTSRIAGYVTRMSGGVGGALSDGLPYPYGHSFIFGNTVKNEDATPLVSDSVHCLIISVYISIL